MVSLSNVLTYSEQLANVGQFLDFSANNSSCAGFPNSRNTSSTSYSSDDFEDSENGLSSHDSCTQSSNSTTQLLKQTISQFSFSKENKFDSPPALFCPKSFDRPIKRSICNDSSEDEEYICICQEASSEEEEDDSSSSSDSSSTVDEPIFPPLAKTPDTTILPQLKTPIDTVTLGNSPRKSPIKKSDQIEKDVIETKELFSTPPQSKTRSLRKKSVLTPLTLHPNIYQDVQENKLLEKTKSMTYTVCLNSCKYDLIHRVSGFFGLRPIFDDTECSLIWTDNAITLDRLSRMRPYQKINHFPEMSEICSKAQLARNLNRMHLLFPKDYNIFPKTWTLPIEFKQFHSYAHCHQGKNTYIHKPKNGCQGKGIKLTNNISDIFPSDHGIYQIYVPNPLLIDGLKFDMRIYTLVTSCNPLRIFVYNEGLARFTTQPYEKPNEENLKKVFMHLTNYSLQRHSDNYIADDEQNGTKRRLTTIYKWLKDNAYDPQTIWNRIDDVIIKTVISCHAALKHSYKISIIDSLRPAACFELLGFDILLDDNLVPYVLEVNHSPSFSAGSSLDKDVKESLIWDTLNLIDWENLEETRHSYSKNLANFNNAKVYGQTKQDTKSIPTLVCRSRFTQMMAENVLKTETHELEHLGNFRRVYPCNDDFQTRYYSKFFVEQNYQSPTESSKIKCKPSLSMVTNWCPISKDCQDCDMLDTMIQSERKCLEICQIEPMEAAMAGNLTDNLSTQSSPDLSHMRIAECEVSSMKSKSDFEAILSPNLDLLCSFVRPNSNQGDSFAAESFASESTDPAGKYSENNVQNSSYADNLGRDSREKSECDQLAPETANNQQQQNDNSPTKNKTICPEDEKFTDGGLQSQCAGDQFDISPDVKLEKKRLICLEKSHLPPPIERHESWFNSTTCSEYKDEEKTAPEEEEEELCEESNNLPVVTNQSGDIHNSKFQEAAEPNCVDDQISSNLQTFPPKESPEISNISDDFKDQEISLVNNEPSAVTTSPHNNEQIACPGTDQPAKSTVPDSKNPVNSWQDLVQLESISTMEVSFSSQNPPKPAKRESLVNSRNDAQIPDLFLPQSVLKHSVYTQVENENTIAQLLKDVVWEDAPIETNFRTPMKSYSSDPTMLPVAKAVSRSTSVDSAIVFELAQSTPIALQNKNLELLYQQYTPTSLLSEDNPPQHYSIAVDTKSPQYQASTLKTIHEIPTNFVAYSYPGEDMNKTIASKIKANFICSPSHIALPLDSKELRRLKYVFLHRQELLEQYQIREIIIQAMDRFHKTSYRDILSKNEDSLLISERNRRSKETLGYYFESRRESRTADDPANNKSYKTIKKNGPLLRNSHAASRNLNFQPDKPPLGKSNRKFVEAPPSSNLNNMKLNRNPFRKQIPSAAANFQQSFTKQSNLSQNNQSAKFLPNWCKSVQNKPQPKITKTENKISCNNGRVPRSNCNYISSLYTHSNPSKKLSARNHQSNYDPKTIDPGQKKKPLMSKVKRISNSPGRHSTSSASLPSHLNHPNSCLPTDQLGNNLDQVVRIGLQKKLNELKHRQ